MRLKCFLGGHDLEMLEIKKELLIHVLKRALLKLKSIITLLEMKIYLI